VRLEKNSKALESDKPFFFVLISLLKLFSFKGQLLSTSLCPKKSELGLNIPMSSWIVSGATYDFDFLCRRTAPYVFTPAILPSSSNLLGATNI
jgi:hypothetical protein